MQHESDIAMGRLLITIKHKQPYFLVQIYQSENCPQARNVQ